MQPQGNAPGKAPTPIPQGPVAVPPESSGPSRLRWIVPILVVGALAGIFYWRQISNNPTQSAAAVTVVRTTEVRSGAMKNELRLTGTTGAERFSQLLAPQLRGSRSGFGRDSRSFSSSRGGGSTTVTSRAAGASSSGTTASSSGMSADGSMASSAGAASNSRSSSAMQSATSRVSRGGSSTPSSSSRSSGSSAAASSSMGESGLGSTSNSLSGGSSGPGSIGGSSGGGGGGSRGGGGGSEFSLVLQDAAKPGVIVKKGDPVAEFDRQYMLTRLDDYRASVIQSEASFKKLEAELDVARKAHRQTIDAALGELDKAKLTMKTTPVMGAIEAERSKLAMEEAEARYSQLLKEVQHMETSLKSELRNAQIELQQSRIELRRAEANADRMVLKSPIDGMVVMQNMFRGTDFDQIKVGDQLFPGMPFMQIVDARSMVINANVSQVDVEKLRIGQKALVHFDAFPGLVLPARVHAVGSVGKSSRYRPDWIKEMAVVLKLERMDPRIIPDLSVSADIQLETEENATVVPLEAVHFDGNSESPAGTPRNAFVWVRAGDAWERRRVELGLTSYTQASIKSGLRPGETVALEIPPQERMS